MVNVSRAQMEILVKAVDQASGPLRDVANATEGVEKSASNLNGTMQAALGALSAYAGSRGMMMLVQASEQASMQISQARFFLAGLGGDVSKNLASIQQWAVGMQKAGIAGDEYATVVGAKLANRLKSISKAQEYSNVLLRGERLGLLNAQEAANMMIRATEGNERALRFLVEQMGIAAPEFVSMQTLFEELRRRIEEGEKSMSPFASAMMQLRENIGDFAEKAGTPIAATFAKMIGAVNSAIDRFPALGEAVSAVMVVVTTALTGLGAGLGFASLLRMFGITAAAAGPWGLVIGAVIGGVVYYLAQLSTMSEDTKRIWQMVFTGLAAAAAIAAVAINAAFFAPLIALFGVLAVVTSMSIEGYELSWQGFVDYMGDTMTGLGIMWKETWGSMFSWITDQWNSIVGFVTQKVDAIVNSVTRALSAMMSLPGVSAISSAVKTVTGKRASGGPVNAGASYLVGERGPEIFTPRTSGSIVANGGGSVLVDMRGSTFIDRQAAVELGDEIIKRFKELYRIGY